MSRHIILTPQQQALLGDADAIADANMEAILAPVLCMNCGTYIPLGWLGRKGCRGVIKDMHMVLDQAVVTTITDRIVNQTLRGRS